MSGSYSHWCRDCDPAYAETVFRQGVTRVLVYEGADDQQRPVNDGSDPVSSWCRD